MRPSKPQKYPPNRVIAVDVDNTLHVKGVLNEKVVSFCRNQKEQGFYLILWSARGEKYARAVAAHFDVADIFDVILSKPGYILDDEGWGWIKFTRVIQNLTPSL